MSPLRTEHRMQEIQHMLLEMAGGNFFYRLETSDRNDNVEALAIVLNMLAEEIQESFYHQGYVSSKGTTEHLVQMCFLLDGNGMVQMANHPFQIAREYCPKAIFGPVDGSLPNGLGPEMENHW